MPTYIIESRYKEDSKTTKKIKCVDCRLFCKLSEHCRRTGLGAPACQSPVEGEIASRSLTSSSASFIRLASGRLSPSISKALLRQKGNRQLRRGIRACVVSILLGSGSRSAAQPLVVNAATADSVPLVGPSASQSQPATPSGATHALPGRPQALARSSQTPVSTSGAARAQQSAAQAQQQVKQTGPRSLETIANNETFDPLPVDVRASSLRRLKWMSCP